MAPNEGGFLSRRLAGAAFVGPNVLRRPDRAGPSESDGPARLPGRLPGVVISKETLLNEVWHTEAISESALTRTITELRQAVADDADQPRCLETIPKRGYRLIATVRPVMPPEESRAQGRRVPAAAIWMAALLLVLAGILAVLSSIGPCGSDGGPRVKPLTSWPG